MINKGLFQAENQSVIDGQDRIIGVNMTTMERNKERLAKDTVAKHKIGKVERDEVHIHNL